MLFQVTLDSSNFEFMLIVFPNLLYICAHSIFLFIKLRWLGPDAVSQE